MIRSGERLTHLLRQSNAVVDATLWLQKDDETWKFIVASSKLDESGPRDAYEQVWEALQSLRASGYPSMGIQNVSVVSPDSTLIRNVARATSADTNGITRKRITDNVIGNFYVNDALVYRMDEGAMSRDAR